MKHYTSVPRYEAYRRFSALISNSGAEALYVKPARFVSHKLVEIFLELCTLCSPMGFLPFLKPRLESVCSGHRDIPPHLDLEAWRMAVLELAICDSNGKLRLVVVLGTIGAGLNRALSELHIATFKLSGTQSPQEEALLLVEMAKSNTTFFRWGLSAPQLKAMLEINHKLLNGFNRVGAGLPLEADLKRVTDPQLEAAAHEVRTSRWFLSHEVALSALIRPTVNVRNAHVVEFFRTSSIDGVVYLTTPFVEPVLAIEWDGADYHDRPAAVARDSLKEALLSQVGIPLLRIKGADPAEDLSLRQEKRHADFAAQLYIIRDLVHAYVSAVWKLRIREKCEREHVPYPAEAAGTTYRHPKAVLKTEMRRLGLDDTLLVSYDITELDGFRCPNALVLTHCGERHFETYGARCRFTVIPQRELDEITLIACASDIAEGINNFVRNEPQKEMPQFS